MNMTHRTGPLSVSLLAVLLAACGGPPPPAEISPEPPPVVEEVAEEVAAVPEAEIPLEERWRSPFAVSSAGRTVPRVPREVAIIGADPSIARALEDVQADPDAAADGAVAPAPTATAPTRAAADPPTVAPVDPAPPASGDPAERFHLVERGETWAEIARENGISTASLAAANPGVEPGRIQAGQRLRLPPPEAPTSETTTHRVRPGDTLWGIARQYDVTEQAIRELNDLTTDRVRLGQTLLIPTEAGDS
jgi:LysM repeat protein